MFKSFSYYIIILYTIKSSSGLQIDMIGTTWRDLQPRTSFHHNHDRYQHIEHNTGKSHLLAVDSFLVCLDNARLHTEAACFDRFASEKASCFFNQSEKVFFLGKINQKNHFSYLLYHYYS